MPVPVPVPVVLVPVVLVPVVLVVVGVVSGRVRGGVGARRAGGGVRVCGVLGLVVVVVWVCGLLVPGVALGSGGWWSLGSGLRPSSLEVEGEGEVVVSAENVGSGVVNGGGGVARVVDRLPVGLGVVSVGGAVPVANVRLPVGCVVVSVREVSCEFGDRLVPFEQVEVRVGVRVEPGARSGEVNEVVVEGGEAGSVSLRRPIVVSDRPVGFGVQSYSLVNEEVGGGEDLLAGSHPFQQTTSFELNQTADTTPVSKTPDAEPAVLPKDLDFRWPAGLVGNPTVLPTCSDTEFLAVVGDGDENECPADTAVGVASVTVNEPSLFKASVFVVPVFNLEPEVGEPARFGINVVEANAPVYIDAAVRTGGDYGVTVKSQNITQTAGLLSAKVTVWGVPGAAAHDGQRGWGCLLRSLGDTSTKPCNVSEGREPAPFLSLPSQCGVPLESVMEGDSWERPGEIQGLGVFSSPGLVGCEGLGFGPELGVSASTVAGSSPVGLGVRVRVPQELDENPVGVDSSTVRSVVVRFPEGVTVNPAAASGLQACSESEIGYLPGESVPPERLRFTAGVPGCPAAARVGTVRIVTPLLARPLTGFVYLAAPENTLLAAPGENPFQSLIAMYLVAEDPVSHTLVKLAGRVSLNEQTGRVQASFENTPQLDFETAEVDLFSGERAALSTAAGCGSYSTEAVFTPWSGGPSVTSTAAFTVTTGPAGGGCPGGVLPFSTTLAGGSTSIQAGAYTPVSTTIARGDGQQPIGRVSVRLPEGLAGVLSGIPLCSEAQANTGSCPAGSEIGQASATVGTGSQPYTVTGGQVYLTSGFEGAPFGLSILTPAVAGPFDLGQVIVRASVQVNPVNGQITVTTSPNPQYAIPQMLKGIPLQIKTLNVLVNRPDFTFNPTDCEPLSITATNTGSQGTTSTNTIPFRVANCDTLRFSPSFTATASSKISRVNGISFKARLSYPNTGWGTQANIAKVKVILPKSLPSRDSTLNKACPAHQFETNPALCDPASIVGHATVTTPLLPVPLSGPAYFVSHGNEAFPALTLLLQGYGITIQLTGDTYIHNATTSTTFNTIPDLPFNTFELNLPANRYSALSGYGNLCKTKPKLQIQYTAQNNHKTTTNTTIKLTNCPKHKTKTKHHH